MWVRNDKNCLPFDCHVCLTNLGCHTRVTTLDCHACYTNSGCHAGSVRLCFNFQVAAVQKIAAMLSQKNFAIQFEYPRIRFEKKTVE